MTDRIILRASEGHIYTNGETYGRVVYLAVGANATDWYEITEAEYEAEMAEIQQDII